MKTSTELFELIKSLTKTEKRYFKLSASGFKKEDNNYLKLFNALDKQSEYDEKKIVAQFPEEKFIKELRVTKKYLYKLITRSLISYHEESSVNSKLKYYLRCAEVLFEKGLLIGA